MCCSSSFWGLTSLRCPAGGRWNVTNSNEDGLLGVAVDPNFTKNGYLYVYYSPIALVNPTQNVLSRYTMRGDEVDLTTELRMISIRTQVRTPN